MTAPNNIIDRLRNAVRVSVGVIALVTYGSVAAEGERLYGAPSTGAAVAPTGSGSIGQVTLALAIVLAFVFVAAGVLKYLKKINIASTPHQLQVIAQVSVGPKERAVLVRVNGVQVLLGVAPGQVTALHTFSASEIITGENASATTDISTGVELNASVPAAPSFKALLRQGLGLS